MVQRDSLMEEEEEEENNTTTIFPSPLPGDDDSVLLQPHHDQPSSPNKRRISRRKKVVTYPIGDGLRTRGSDVYPPPDSWSWRKYGQKPIKGSPYPRGYYRCSTSKGCPAKKQVERSRHDPTTLLITYSCDHNHSTTRTSHHQPDPPASSTPLANFSSEECAAFANQTEIEPATSSTFVELAGELGWLCEVDSTMMNKTTFITPVWTHAEVEVVMPIGEEDKLLFGDLGDLPESAVVFRHSEFL